MSRITAALEAKAAQYRHKERLGAAVRRTALAVATYSTAIASQAIRPVSSTD
jgi:hypothetical protein